MRVIKTRIVHIPLRKWFPPKDPIATTVARLCVLREDLYLELNGVKDESIPALDEHSSDWRQVYFFRNSTRTLSEIRNAVETLRMKKSFMQRLSKQPRELTIAFDDLSKAFNISRGLIKNLRDEIAGHLGHEAFHDALERIDLDTKGLFQMGKRANEIHYKFALEFIGATILRRVPYSNAKEEWQKIIKKTSELSFTAIRAIDMLFIAYLRVNGYRL